MNNDKFSYPKGSEWRKWDLQIHCPNDVLNNQFEGTDPEEKWEKYLKQLEASDLKVVGLTNYFCIDGYEKILEFQKQGRLQNIKLILPNIEFRISQPNRKGEFINIHLIFSDTVGIDKIKAFLKRLPLINTTSTKKALYCSSEDLTLVGYDKALIDLVKMKEKLKEDFSHLKDYLIFGTPRGYGSFRPEKDEGRGISIATEIDKICDAFFGNIEDTPYFLNTTRYDKALPKPVVLSSDSHELDSINTKFTWIKADPTFEGLKQIVYEPKDRVKIQTLKPEEKTTYLVIDKVRFIDNTGKNNFPSDYIELNQNLTNIIGGKSTGKSLLLYYVAKSIDNREVDKRFQKIDGIRYFFEQDTNFNFEVIWQDGEKNFLRESSELPTELLDEGSPQSKRKIIYIPQNYLNKLSEKDIETKETLNEFVLQVLVQNPEAKKQHELSLDRIAELEKEISIETNQLFLIEKDINDITQQVKNIGDEKGIIKYISKINKEIEEIKNKSGLTQEEIKQYGELTEKEKNCKNNLANLNSDRARVQALGKALASELKTINTIREEYQEYIINKNIKDRINNELEFLTDYKDKVVLTIANIISGIDSEIKSNQEELLKIAEALKPLISKVKLQEGLKVKSRILKQEEGKLNKIKQLQNELKIKEKSYATKKEKILELYKEIFNVYKSLQNEFKKHEKNFEEISLNVVIRFKEKEFNEDVVNEFLNKKDLKLLLGSSWSEEFEYQYNPDSHLDNITKIFYGVLNSKVRTIKNKPRKDAVLKVLEDKFYLDFNITYQNDSLDKMSPGKKGLVLLKLIIDLTKEKWPILLDQPDDDLDNRSVYSDLVAFVKRKKKGRQIIIVTHNPNLVVGADAEEIIVANQSGQELGRDNRKFKFEYVSGALENSFEAEKAEGILYKKGIREHVCEVLEGGEEAFQKREQRYNFPK